ncbi:uncharacterized protein LOC130537163 isoform X2 [Takifugu flavidus]|uniref:uncharacterized protein LOC130537163 isoform X2 n=1 Tax=Takifugu flavidus TaxID=433684 RepID=UPI002544CB6B|nr:uncharacterized protein LOC130537163 isoform X2 [Takifugu flavidus]
MAAMMCFLLLLLLLNSSKSDSSAVDVFTVQSGEAVQLLSGLNEAEQKQLHDIRWTHSNLLLVMKNNMTKCNDDRCELLADGTLSFSRTETQDSGKYLMQAFDKDGKRFKAKEIFLQVNSESTSGGGGGGVGSIHIVATSIATCCVFLLLLTVTHYIIKRRRAVLRRTTDIEENLYVEMRRNTIKEEETYSLYNNVVSMETPRSQQDSPDVQDD